jgi:hypothetical protein
MDLPVIGQGYRPESKFLLNDPVICLPAADMLVLVAAAHMGESPLFESVKSHGCRIMVTGEKIARFVREALPAFEPERLVPEIKRPAVDKKHAMVRPFHRHGIEEGEKRRIPQLLVAVRARRIAAAHHDTVEKCMIMVPENGYEPVFLRERVDFLQRLLGPAAAVKEIAKVHQEINRAECLGKGWIPDAGCKCTDSCCICVHIRKYYGTHTVARLLDLLSHIYLGCLQFNIPDCSGGYVDVRPRQTYRYTAGHDRQENHREWQETTKKRQNPMERFLDAYIERTRPHFPGFPAATAHEIASAFLAYRYGLYENAARECSHAISLIPDSPANAGLKKALAIVRANAEDRNNSQVTADLSIAFTDAERVFVPIVIPPEKNDDPGTLELDNALIMIYVVALITSTDDEEALEEHRKTILRLLTDYKKAMGLE